MVVDAGETDVFVSVEPELGWLESEEVATTPCMSVVDLMEDIVLEVCDDDPESGQPEVAKPAAE